MNNSSIVSAVLGGTFFAIPYLGLSAGILPSLAIGVGAFCAGELLFHVNKKAENEKSTSLREILLEAKNENSQIGQIIPKIEDPELVNTIKEIKDSVEKIINTIENKPERYKNMNKFFNYYLPVTIKILNRYDEIENQKLTSKESKKFMESTKEMVFKINEAFKKQLSSLYQSDIIDTDAEMKIFDSMLKADGYNEDKDFKIKKEGEG